jgi:2'-5' RNA ligase
MPAELTRQHATAFLEPGHSEPGRAGPGRSEPVERLRRTWDPEMARQIAAHVTLIYPREIAGPAELVAAAERAAARTPPFQIAVGAPMHTGSLADGVFLRVDDLDGGIRRFRAAAVPAGRALDFPPHVTIVHPRTSGQGERAWAELAGLTLSLTFTITEVAITAFDGDRWQTLQRFLLAGRLPG